MVATAPRLLRRLAIVWACLLVAWPALASSGRLQLDVKELTVGQSGRLMLYMVDGRPAGVPTLTSPSGTELRYQGSSTRFQMDNFSRTLLHSYEYRLTGLEPGRYTFGPYEVRLTDGSTVTTNTVELVVRERTEAASVQMEAVSGFDTAEAYAGEVVIYSYRLVARVPVLGADWRLPPFEGLRAPHKGQPEERSYYVDDPDGSRTTIVEGAIPLIATGTGSRDQPAAIAQVRLPVGRTDLLGFRQYRTEAMPTEPSPLRVQPLPGPQPGAFSGLVGDFRFRARLESKRAAVGESVTWILEAMGDGALEGWKPPAYQDISAALYENDASSTARVQDGRYVAQGVWRRVVVPTEPGVLQLPPLTVITFSPSRGEYVTHEVEVGALEVTGGRETSTSVESFAGEAGQQADPVEVELDFRSIYTRGPSRVIRIDGALPWLSALASLPGLVVVLGVFGDRAREWRAARRRRLEKPVTAGDVLRSLPDAPSDRLAALEAALRLALADRAGVPVEGLDRRAALDALPQPLRDRAVALAAALDRARFASEAPDDVAGLRSEVVQLVAEIAAAPRDPEEAS